MIITLQYVFIHRGATLSPVCWFAHLRSRACMTQSRSRCFPASHAEINTGCVSQTGRSDSIRSFIVWIGRVVLKRLFSSQRLSVLIVRILTAGFSSAARLFSHRGMPRELTQNRIQKIWIPAKDGKPAPRRGKIITSFYRILELSSTILS